MDLGLVAESESAGQPAKRAAVGTSSRDVNKIMVVTAKLSLASALATRVVKAVAVEMYRVDSKCGFLQKLHDATYRVSDSRIQSPMRAFGTVLDP